MRWNNLGAAAKFAVVGLWLVGLVIGIKLVQKFEAELKPLVLAFVFIAILETVVQLFEWIFLKMYVFLTLFVWSVWCLMKMTWRLGGNLCCSDHHKDLKDITDNLAFYWKWLLKPWTAQDAGLWVSFRILAVIHTLTLLVVIFTCIFTVFNAEIQSIVEKLNIYKEQIESMAAHFGDAVNSIATYFPASVAPYVKSLVDKGKSAWGDIDIWELLKKHGDELFEAIWALSAGFFSQLVFFLLYTVFLLLAPLHLGGGPEKCPNEPESKWTRWFGWPNYVEQTRMSLNLAENSLRLLESTQEDIDEEPKPRVTTFKKVVSLFKHETSEDKSEEDEADEEIQQYLYNIMWNYFMMLILLNFLFALLVFVLLNRLEVDLSFIIAAAAFFLSFIPELGSIISMLLPIPFILLTPLKAYQTVDAHPWCADCPSNPNACVCDFSDRLGNLLIAMLWLMAIKLVVHNLLYSCLMGKNRALSGAVEGTDPAEIVETHGVIVLFAVVFFGHVWGTTGMLISVPLISVIRLSLNLVHCPKDVTNKLNEARKSRKCR
eukprot:TRINITY_DN38797_c0_g1_i1.p1 TRINITY_DN38797_c0_g1~~TRINITY_DN38797_c0_g1_i1.p1  ORF type:complete len:545 (-),score=73.92 TRINITY_DN38797_c0_g1_i1:88-1722(-)